MHLTLLRRSTPPRSTLSSHPRWVEQCRIVPGGKGGYVRRGIKRQHERCIVDGANCIYQSMLKEELSIGIISWHWK